jgi:hypothetical protein
MSISIRTFRVAAAAFVLAGLLGSLLPGPAVAAERGRREVVHHRAYHPARQESWGYDRPTYVQAPPPVIYSPPAYSPGINLMFNIR